MKRKMLGLFLTGLIAMTLPLSTLSARAASTVVDGGSCVYDGSKLIDSTKEPETSLTPGSAVTTNVTFTNSSAETVNAYLSNSVVSDLEDSKSTATGAAYTYTLAYTPTGSSASTVLYDSEKVGGEGGSGLSQAVSLATGTASYGDYYYLGQLAPGASVIVSLTVGLDGETTVNTYQLTNAQTALKFAVESIAADVSHETEEETKIVSLQGESVTVSEDGSVVFSAPRTGDETQLWLFVVILGLCSLGLGICLALKVFPVGKRERRRQR